MSQSDRAIKKLATDLARLKREVVSWRGAQADYTSIENGGNFTFKDGDGNVTAIVGGQDDGSNTIRHVDGPVPPIPSGLTAHVDGPIVQVSWDGSFEDADEATYDWSHLEVVAVGPDNTNLRATINDVTGATANLAATVSGEWTVVARSVSRAEKRSLDGDAGTVEVKLVDIDGAIDAVQDSANGKNKVTYSDRPPTPADPGIFDDTWFVGQVGRPNDVIEATNLVPNPSFEAGLKQAGLATGAGGGATISTDTSWSLSGAQSVKVSPNGSASSAFYPWSNSYAVTTDAMSALGLEPGKTYTASATIMLLSAQSGSLDSGARKILVGTNDGSTVGWNFAASPAADNAAGVTRLSVTFTIPAGETIFLRLMNGSTGTPVWWDGLTIEEGTTTGEFFDGDTEDGTTDNESHYRWTGTPHASTSEKYLPALNIGDSDNWNVIEQYRHDGSGWVKVELSHRVFSTVDLGKATVGELDGIRIMGQTVRGEQLSGDAIDGKVITGGTYRTTDGTGQWSDAGLFIAQPDGTSMVRFPTDGSPLSLTASDTQIERASIGELDLSYGAVRSGGKFTLASGVTTPASPPELTTGWQKVASLPNPEERADVIGLASWGNKWVRGVNVLGTGEGDRVEIYNADGTLYKTIPIAIDPQQDITVIGDIVYVFGKDHDIAAPRAFIFGYDLNTGARVSRHEYTRSIQAKNALGNDGTNLIIASVYNRELWVHRRDPVTGVQVGPDMRSGSNTWSEYANNNNLYGVHIDGTELTVVPRQTARVYTIDGGTLTRKTNTSNASGFAGWDNPNKNGAGMVWRDGLPCVVDGVGDVYRGSPFVSDKTVQLCFTWTNGTYETTPSPLVTFQAGARESFTVTLPQRTGLAKRLYYRSGTSGSWVMKGVAEGTTAYVVSDVQGFAASLPTVNTFPNADPATLKSTNDKFEVKGDGSGHWGHFNVDANGAMSGLIVSGSASAYVDTANTSKKFTVQLPPGRFTKPPVVWVQVSTAIPNLAFAGVVKEEIGTTSFDFWFNRHNTTTTSVTWFAMDSE